MEGQTKLRSKAREIVEVEFEKACDKHPIFPGYVAPGIVALTEEFLELCRSVNDHDPVDRQIEEAAHVAVIALRIIETLLKEKERYIIGRK